MFAEMKARFHRWQAIVMFVEFPLYVIIDA